MSARELVEAYTHCADRRDAKGQMALFTPHTHFVVYMNAKDPKPSQELHSRKALAPVFADLNKYAATMHFIGQSTILSLSGNRTTGEGTHGRTSSPSRERRQLESRLAFTRTRSVGTTSALRKNWAELCTVSCTKTGLKRKTAQEWSHPSRCI